MKQKKIGDILYVYSTTAYEITVDGDANVIKIQEECIPAYAALNASLVSKFSPINYKLFCVKHPEWADYMDDYFVHIINTIGEGTATATPNSGDEGEEITLSATPATGWEFVCWRVQPLHGSGLITVTDNKFTMPADDVRVQTEFDKIDFDITVDDQIQNGSLSAPETANLGDTVTITATPASGYKLDTLTVMCGSLEITVVDNQFTMPAGDVTVTGTFVQDIVPYEEQYFTIESEADNNSITIVLDKTYNGQTRNNFSYSLDNGETWTNGTPSDYAYEATVTLDNGEKILVKSTNDTFNVDTDDGVITGNSFKAYGNIMSLLYGDNFANQTSFPANTTNNLEQLFMYAGITDASNLILPATTLADHCYEQMFQWCSNLVTAPQLPATTIGSHCYYSMFYECTSLTTAPDLHATTLVDYCYSYMFYGCTSLRDIGMYATTLGDLSTNSALYNIVYNTYADGIPSEQKNGKMYVSSSLSTQQKDAINDRLVVNESYDYWTVADYVPAS